MQQSGLDDEPNVEGGGKWYDFAVVVESGNQIRLGGDLLSMSVNEVFGAAKADLYNGQTTIARVSTSLKSPPVIYKK